MEKNLFDIVGKNVPYIMPDNFDPASLMANAISIEQNRKKSHRRIIWLSTSAAVAAVALLVLFLKPTSSVSDPMGAYQTALSQYCDYATEAEMQAGIDMVEADYVANIDHYEAYYN